MSRKKPQAYGDGSVYQRADGRWVATIEAGYTASGKRRRVTVTGKTEPEVRRKLRDKKAEIAANAGRITDAAKARMTVKQWTDEWLTERQTTVRPKTYESDRWAVRNYVVPTIGAERLVDLAPRDVRRVAAKTRAKAGDASALRVQRCLVKCLRDASEEGYPITPGIFAMKAPSQPVTDRQALDTAQAVAALAHARDLPGGVRWFVAFYQGLRQGEVLGLTEDSIDWVANTLTIDWQLQPLTYADKQDRSQGFVIPVGYEAKRLRGRFHLVRPKSSKGYRVIPMVPTVRAALETWLDDPARPRNPWGLLWCREDGWPIDKADDSKVWRALQDAANVKHPSGRHYYGHEIRNTTATLLLEARVDPVIITAILGHSSIVTSRGYMTARSDALTAALEGVEAAFTSPADAPPELNAGEG
ncbi:tyrosine-type recombinase/integrase family protein [Nocardioides sp. ChNu-153]|uniref:site-specific integrase n=1 Tax=Nocardioides sp. ChNu-153 TaxID=2779364 RepID=UPI0026561AEA|nr:tyrosine-type recombinase/integrase [Nocardioides sp. ChNu-153]MDN7120252.1 tyrosine-type recombinase/integrase family protein [Nocardioides sp. ChNu-153]